MANGIQAMQGMGGGQPYNSYQLGGNPWSLKNFFLGSQDRINQIPTVTPDAANALQQLLQQGLGNVTGQNTSSFAPLSKQARSQFEQQTLPSIAERFTGLGAQRSSAFGQQLGQAGAGLEENLAARQQQQGLQQLGLGLTPQFENIHTPGSAGLFSNLFGSALQGLGQPLSSQGGNQGQDLFQMLAKLLPLLL